MARVNSYITKGKGTYGGADKDLHEENVEEACWTGYTQKGMKKKGSKMVPNCVPVKEDIDSLFEMQLVGTDEYRDHAIATTPGQKIENAYGEKDCACGGVSACQCGQQKSAAPAKPLSSFRKKAVSEAADQSAVDFTPTAKTKKTKKGLTVPTAQRNVTLDGMPTVSSKISAESKEISFSSLRKNKTK
jgi:hypothetical protein